MSRLALRPNREQLFDMWAVGDQRRIRGLAINKRPTLRNVANTDQYPAKSSVRMSSSSTWAATSIALRPATMGGGPAT